MAGEATQTLVKSFTCAACGAPVNIRAAGLTLTAVCAACGSTSEQSDGLFTLVKKAQDAVHILPRIPLGKKGKILDKTFQVIGFMRKSEEVDPDDYWDEYLLFNPYEGFRFLFEYKGHWTLFKMTKALPETATYRHTIKLLNQTYKIFHEGTSVVRFVVGEFYWRVRVGDTAQTTDCIAPPQMLSCERSFGEIVWSVGTYLEPQQVIEAYQPARMPTVHGVAANQPPLFEKIENFYATWAVAFVFLFFLQIISIASQSGKYMDAQSVTTYGEPVADVEIAQIEMATSSLPIMFEVKSSANQSWTTVQLRFVPVDPENKSTFEFEKDLSYYAGYTDGESWAENDENAEFLVGGVPKGQYRVLLSVTPESGHKDVVQTRYMIRPSVWSNFWLAFLLISIPAGYFALRNRSFERKRWEGSERNPFEPHDNGGGHF